MTIHIPGVVLTVAGYILAALAALWLALWLWVRFTPSHWALGGPMRRARPAHEVFRYVNVAGGHAATLRKLLRLGPWAFYVVRYAPGDFEEAS